MLGLGLGLALGWGLGLGLCCDKISNVNETENNSGELTDKYQKPYKFIVWISLDLLTVPKICYYSRSQRVNDVN